MTDQNNSNTFPDFSNTFGQLPKAFYSSILPTPIKAPYLIHANYTLAASLNFGQPYLSSEEFIQVFSGNQIGQGSKPLAAVYSGHQFGVWAGQLGDGRAILLGDVETNVETNIETNKAQRLELQLKGSGMTPYSRMGDGRAVLRSSIREYLCSEAMHGLGIPTSRALCLIGSNQYVMREQPETIAVVTRVAESFIRFGSFEHWYYNSQADQLNQLADFVIAHYYPHLQTAENPYQALLKTVTEKTAELVAHWQAVGFMHGVLNTDNMSILGLTLDYGPYGFMEAFDPEHICNHSDNQGRYSYQMQPRIGQWNCHALAQALLPLIGDVESTQEALSSYTPHFEKTYHQLLMKKFGLIQNQADDESLFASFFDIMQSSHADFTLSFRNLGKVLIHSKDNDEAIRDLFVDRPALDAWLVKYRARLVQENSIDQQRQTLMNSANPKYVLRNYLAQQAIEKAEQKDFSEVDTLFKILKNPFDEQVEYEKYAQLPPDWANDLAVSCSS
jgi:uncharacterized protein YdiU (UPF0061 family)